MQAFAQHYQPNNVDWHHIQGGADFTEYKLDYQYSILGYDLDSGRLDMLMRFKGNGGYCERHRHAASTTTLILEGEQHLQEAQSDGSLKTIIRKAGAYALAGADAHAHMERGGDQGCTLLLSLHAPNKILFEVMDINFNKLADVGIEEFVQRWQSR